MEALEQSLVALLETLRTTATLVDEYRVENVPRLQDGFNTLAAQFGSVATLARTVGQDVELPKELFE